VSANRFAVVFGVGVLLAQFALASESPGSGGPVLAIGSRLELFVDDYLVDALRGIDFRLHPPQRAGKVLTFDKPWEGIWSGAVVVFQDGERYRMYYRGWSSDDKKEVNPVLLLPGESVVPSHEDVTCYAESRDGIRWTRPSLGLVEFQGSKDNNIVLKGHSHAFAPFKDQNPKAPPAERYKAVAIGQVGKSGRFRRRAGLPLRSRAFTERG